MEIPGFVFRNGKYYRILADSAAQTTASQRFSKSAVAAAKRKAQLPVSDWVRSRQTAPHETTNTQRLLKARSVGAVTNVSFQLNRVRQLQKRQSRQGPGKVLDMCHNSQANGPPFIIFDNGYGLACIDNTGEIQSIEGYRSSSSHVRAVRQSAAIADMTVVLELTDNEPRLNLICHDSGKYHVFASRHIQKSTGAICGDVLGTAVVLAGEKGKIWTCFPYLQNSSTLSHRHNLGVSDIKSVSYVDDSTILAGNRRGVIGKCDLRSKDTVLQFNSQVSGISSLQADAKSFVSSSDDGFISVWDARWNTRPVLKFHQNGSSSLPDKTKLYTNTPLVEGANFLWCLGEDDVLRAWSLSNGKVVSEKVEKHHTQRENSTGHVVSWNGGLLVSRRNVVEYWNV